MAIRSTFFQHTSLYKYTWRSPNDTETQIDHVLIDGRHFSDIIDVRTYRGADIDSDHYLVVAKLRQRLSEVNKIRYRRPQRYNLERLKDPEVATQYARELEAALPDEGELAEAPLEACWSHMEAAINAAASSAIGYVDRVRRNGWFDEECQAIWDEKKVARDKWLLHNTRGNKESYKQLRRQQTHLFRDKKRRLEELECQDMEQLYRSNETRKFYKKLSQSRAGFMPRAEICRDKDGGILTDEREVIERWKQHFDEHLNGPEAEYQGDGGNDVSGMVDGEDEPV
ncbi:uncharacterized protein LOC120430808 isoform X2 [Culex pipiens pallens]|uniref:uncharacterized protein LOC120430808 isoform X2 n=1 Tax=Culex pipiens pallens TaxID=42434 RepID=UPI0022AAC2BF|nr:uncharacterized protein LOC120430808 isoform X2 [Culex pipiens pallens]